MEWPQSRSVLVSWRIVFKTEREVLVGILNGDTSERRNVSAVNCVGDRPRCAADSGNSDEFLVSKCEVDAVPATREDLHCRWLRRGPTCAVSSVNRNIQNQYRIRIRRQGCADGLVWTQDLNI